MSTLALLGDASGPDAPRSPVAVTGHSSSTVFGTASLATRYADDLLLGAARDCHGAVARRLWKPLNVATLGAAKPSQVVHDGIAKAVYGGLGAGFRGAAKALDAADRRGLGPRTEDHPTGRFIVSTVHGLIGDRLVDETPQHAIRMAVRLDDADVPATPEALAAAFPEAAEQVVVFVHGLMEHDAHWHRRQGELPSYGEALAATGAWSPVHLRVNTGLPLKENGVALAALLDQLVAAWPTDVRRLALVGHSMGGLLIRAACAVTTDAGEPWNRLVTDVVLLGTPNLGAPLEKLVHVGARILGVLPEAAPFGRILDYRSPGILDLRRGLAGDVQHLPHARYRLVSATIGPSPYHPLSLALGDGLVMHRSAMGQSPRGDLFPDASTLHLGSAHHFDLLNHPDVHRKLQEWLA